MDCSSITASLVAANCAEAPAVAGLMARVILLNHSEINKKNSTLASNVISEIEMKEGKKGFAFTSLDDSATGEFSLNKGTYRNTWQHDLTLRIFTKSEASKAFLNSLNGSRVVAITDNREEGNGTVKHEVYGWDSGLEALEVKGSTAIADGVVYELKLGSGDKSKEGSLPKTFYNTDETTTEAALTALLA